MALIFAVYLHLINDAVTIIEMEIVKLIASVTTPIVLAILGILLLRHVETIKAQVAKRSDFKKRWADGFFETCQGLMLAVERCVALLNSLQSSSDPNGEFGKRCQKEFTDLFPHISELEFRIRRYVTLTPNNGDGVSKKAKAMVDYLGEIVRQRHGSIDTLFSKISDFNHAAISAHGEILGVGGD
jgi:hypothetical protein